MPIRLAYLFGFLLIVALLTTSLYLQFFDGVMPCPLCTLQRFTFAALGIFFFTGIFLAKNYLGRLIINLLAIASSSLGIFLAARQIWLQHFPSINNTECGVSLQYMMQVLPWNEVMQKIFAGSAECSARGWEFFHLNMAEWALIWFIWFLLFSVYLTFKKTK